MKSKREFDGNPDMENSYDNSGESMLILHNDDVHDFDYVIESLIEICGHEPVQAEQCTFLVHFKGLCEVKKGRYADVKEMYDQLIEKELTVSIN